MLQNFREIRYRWVYNFGAKTLGQGWVLWVMAIAAPTPWSTKSVILTISTDFWSTNSANVVFSYVSSFSSSGGWVDMKSKYCPAIATSNIWPAASLEMGNSKLGASHQIRTKICPDIILQDKVLFFHHLFNSIANFTNTNTNVGIMKRQILNYSEAVFCILSWDPISLLLLLMLECFFLQPIFMLKPHAGMCVHINPKQLDLLIWLSAKPINSR